MKSVGFFRMARLSYLNNKKGMEKTEKLSLELEETRKVLRKKLYKMRVLRNELHATKNELRQTQRTLLLTDDKLKDALEKIGMMKRATDNTVTILRDFLFLWLTPMNQFRVKRMLRFYDKEQQVKMMSALLGYVIFGEKTEFMREVERWHFKIICGQIAEDAISLPTHTLMVKLFVKYGLFLQLEQRAKPEAPEEPEETEEPEEPEEAEGPDFRPHGEEW